MVERLATLLAEQAGDTQPLPLFGGRYSTSGNRQIKPAWHRYVEQAQMLLKVLREPTETMLTAGGAVQMPSAIDGKDHTAQVRDIYRAMIRASVEE